MKIRDQRQRTLKDLMVRRVIKNNKVPGTSAGNRAAESPCWGTGSAVEFLGESQAGLCERPGACLDQGGLNRKNFSKRKRENRGTQWLVRELSARSLASGTHPPSAPGLWTWDKLPSLNWSPVARTQISGLEAHTWNPSWPPTPETLGGCALGAQASCPTHRPKAADWKAIRHRPGAVDEPGVLPKPKAADQLINSLAACEGPHLKAPVLNNSYLAPMHRALQGLLAL